MAKDSASPVRGVAARLEPADGAAGTTATAHILLLIDRSKLPRAVGDTKTADLQPLETGIAATVTVGPNGALTIPSDFGRPVLAVDYARLAAVLKGIMPASQDFPLAVDSVILAPRLVPISFNASLKIPGLGLTAEFGALSLDCSRSDCGVSVLTDGKALRARFDKELAKLPRLPAAGGVFLKALHFCPDEQEKDCVAGTLVSPNIADVFGTTDLIVKFYRRPMVAQSSFRIPYPRSGSLRYVRR